MHLLESWNPILPAFIRDNILDQLVLPKVKKAVDAWDPKRSKVGAVRISLAGIVFPWLPMLGDRVDEVLGDAKRRIKSVMRNWSVRDTPPEELARWKKDVSVSAFFAVLTFADLLIERLGQACPAVPVAQARGLPSGRFRRQPSRSRHGPTRAMGTSVAASRPTIHVLASARSRILSQMAGDPLHLAYPAKLQCGRGGYLVCPQMSLDIS